MEHEILNEILTTTVGFLFEIPTNLRPNLKAREVKSIGANDNSTSEKMFRIVSNISKNDGWKENEPNKKIEDLLDYWVMNEGPKLYQESIRRLKIDINKLNRKEMEKMSYEKLNQEKKKIKLELKNYDLSFMATFKRFPLKNEKEPMRPLYIYYKTVKEILLKLTQGLKKMEDENVRAEKKEINTNISTSTNNSSSNLTKMNEMMKKLTDLRKKRDDLRTKFQKYHSEFWKNNNRKIKYAQDIAPIEQDYKIYKSLKEEIAKLEGLIN